MAGDPPPPAPAGGTAPAGDAAPAARLAVLVVDDEEALCELACTWLESLGYRTRGVFSGVDALRALEQERFDLLFTDVVMPGGMDGLALAGAAKRQQPLLRVLLASGYARALAEQASPVGPLLNKPYRKNDLQRAIADVLAAVGGSHEPGEKT